MMNAWLATSYGFLKKKNRPTYLSTGCPLYFNRGQPLQEIIWGLHLKYLNDSDAQYVLVELHEGVCDNHAGGRTLEHRAHS